MYDLCVDSHTCMTYVFTLFLTYVFTIELCFNNSTFVLINNLVLILCCYHTQKVYKSKIEYIGNIITVIHVL